MMAQVRSVVDLVDGELLSKGEEGSSKVLKFGCWLLRRVRAPVFGRPVQRAGGQLRVQCPWLAMAGSARNGCTLAAAREMEMGCKAL